MDTLIKNGDFYKDENSCLKSVTGSEELLQRALICLSVEKGSFSFNRELGSGLHTLCNYEKSKLNDIAYELAADALLGIKEISVKSAEVTVENNIYNINILLLLQGERRLVNLRI